MKLENLDKANKANKALKNIEVALEKAKKLKAKVYEKGSRCGFAIEEHNDGSGEGIPPIYNAEGNYLSSFYKSMSTNAVTLLEDEKDRLEEIIKEL